MHLKIGLCHDLTKPDAETTVLGTLTVDGDQFVRFDWAVDPQAILVPGQFIREVIATTPRMLQVIVEEDWPSFRDSGRLEATNCAEFVAYSLRHSSIYVMDMELT